MLIPFVLQYCSYHVLIMAFVTNPSINLATFFGSSFFSKSRFAVSLRSLLRLVLAMVAMLDGRCSAMLEQMTYATWATTQ